MAYRVFVHDNNDEPGSGLDDLQRDSDRAVWLVSVGEVTGGSGEVLARSVVRALVVAGHVPRARRCLRRAEGGQLGQGGRSPGADSPECLHGCVL